MGTITITVDAGAAGETTKVFTVTNANIQRMVDWSKSRLPQDFPAPTNAQATEAWMKWVMQLSRERVLAFEQAAMTPAAFDVT